MKTLKDIERRLAESVLARDAVQPLSGEPPKDVLGDLDRLPEPGRTSGFYAVPEHAIPGHSRVAGGSNARSGGDAGTFLGRAAGAVPPAVDRTSVLISRGRGSVYRPGFLRRRKVIAVLIAALLALTVGLVTVLLTGGASWPASVPAMQAEITTACQNPDVMPSQARSTSRAPRARSRSCGCSRCWPVPATAVRRHEKRPDGARADRSGPGRRGRLVAEPAPPLQRHEPHRQPGGRSPGDQQHHRWRVHHRRQRRSVRPAGPGEQSGELACATPVRRP